MAKRRGVKLVGIIIIALILVVSFLILSSYYKPLDKYLQPEPVHGSLEEQVEQIECYFSNDCSSSEICQNHFCTELECEKGEEAVNHECTQTTGLYFEGQKYVTPMNPTVLNKLSELTEDNYSEENFGDNLNKVYYYVTSTIYFFDFLKWGVSDYWQSPEVTIQDGTGDCEDQALLLQSLIEALLYKTYGSIPTEVSYVITGCVDLNYDGKTEGCHAWNIIDASKLPEDSFVFFDFDINRDKSPNSREVVLDDVTINGTPPNPKTVSYNPDEDYFKSRKLLAIAWKGRKWVELESTWGMPLSYYEDKTYPYIDVWNAFNSQEYYEYPDFIKQGRKPTIFDDMTKYFQQILVAIYSYVGGLGS